MMDLVGVFFLLLQTVDKFHSSGFVSQAANLSSILLSATSYIFSACEEVDTTMEQISAP